MPDTTTPAAPPRVYHDDELGAALAHIRARLMERGTPLPPATRRALRCLNSALVELDGYRRAVHDKTKHVPPAPFDPHERPRYALPDDAAPERASYSALDYE